MNNIDWQRVVLNLRRSGVSCAELARSIGRNQSVIQRLARGESKRVFFDDAVRLLDIHSDRCPEVHSLEALSVSCGASA